MLILIIIKQRKNYNYLYLVNSLVNRVISISQSANLQYELNHVKKKYPKQWL